MPEDLFTEPEADFEPATQPFVPAALDGPRRFRLAVAGIFSGFVATRFLSVAQRGNPILGIVLGEMGVLFGLYSLLLLIGAIFAPPWVPSALNWTVRKLIVGRTILFLVPVGFLFYVFVVCPILIFLKWLGVL
jgi:hypothetical protein